MCIYYTDNNYSAKDTRQINRNRNYLYYRIIDIFKITLVKRV